MKGAALFGRVLVCAAVVCAVFFFPNTASAYTIQSGFSRSCHERISLPALEFYLLSLQESGEVPLPSDDVWREATGDIRGTIDAGPVLDELLADERLLFAAVSLFIGLREPDTDGYSVSDLAALRSVHGDPTPRAQYAHALRAEGDEGATGDSVAIAGAKDIIRERTAEIAILVASPGASQIITTQLYVEHYGRVPVEVWGPAYHLGHTLHVLQDSFSHSIRTEDFRYILHVLNFVDAFRGGIDESVDGLAHSTDMDHCDESQNRGHVQAALDRSFAMVAAALKLAEGDDGEAFQAGLSDCAPEEAGDMECGWLEYYPECQERVAAKEDLSGTCCDRATDFCDAALLPSILESPTRPYLREAVGCGWTPRSKSGPGALIWLALFFAWMRRRRGRQFTVSWTPNCPTQTKAERAGRSRQLFSWLLGATLFFVAPRAEAQESFPATAVLRLESHGSLLTDASQESALNISYGPALRGGYRWQGDRRAQWGVFGLVERDVWVVSDYELRADPGVVNIAIGVEILYFDYFRTSLGAGPSILVFDAAFHDFGNVGIFTELLPLGARFDFKHRWGITFDPLSVAWVNPTPEYGKAPSVGHLQYRTTIGLEWRAVPRP